MHILRETENGGLMESGIGSVFTKSQFSQLDVA